MGDTRKESQKAKIKMQNDRAKGKIPNPKSEMLNNIEMTKIQMAKTVLNFEFRVSHISSYKNPSKSPFRKGGSTPP